MTDVATLAPPLALIPSAPAMDFRAIEQMCHLFSRSQYVTGSASDIFVIIMYGFELGLPPAMALHTIRFIKGKPCCTGQALLLLLRRARIEIEMPDPATITDAATVRLRRSGGGWQSFSYTRQMASDGGVLTLDNWQRQPGVQLLWRALSQAARLFAPDVVCDLQTIEEVDPAIHVDATGAPIESVTITPPAKAPPPADPPAQTTSSSSESTWADNAQDWSKFATWLRDRKQLTLESAAQLVGMKDYTSASWGKQFTDGKAACIAIEAALKTKADQPARPKAEWVPEIIETALQVYDMTGDEMLKVIGKKSWSDFADKASAETTMHKTAVERQLPVVSTRAFFRRTPNADELIDFETPGIILTLTGGRDTLLQKLGDDGQPFEEANSLTVWESGTHYDIDPIKLVWKKSKKGLITVESVAMVTPYEADELPVDPELEAAPA